MTKKAIVVIDMQRGLVLGAYRQDELVATVNELIGSKLAQLREKATIEILYTPAPQPAPGGAPHGMPMR